MATKIVSGTPDMRSILITGGCGFVGSNITVHLAASFVDVRIVCMDNLYRKGSELNVSRLQNLGIPFHHGDVRTPASFPREAFDVLIECSAEPSVLAGQDGSTDYLFSTNVVGFYHCLEHCRRNGSHMIFLSTSRVYPVAPLEAHGFREEETRFVWTDEGAPAISSRGISEALGLSGARSLYGFTKLAGEQLIEEYRASFGLGAVINRCGAIVSSCDAVVRSSIVHRRLRATFLANVLAAAIGCYKHDRADCKLGLRQPRRLGATHISLVAESCK